METHVMVAHINRGQVPLKKLEKTLQAVKQNADSPASFINGGGTGCLRISSIKMSTGDRLALEEKVAMFDRKSLPTEDQSYGCHTFVELSKNEKEDKSVLIAPCEFGLSFEKMEDVWRLMCNDSVVVSAVNSFFDHGDHLYLTASSASAKDLHDVVKIKKSSCGDPSFTPQVLATIERPNLCQIEPRTDAVWHASKSQLFKNSRSLVILEAGTDSLKIFGFTKSYVWLNYQYYGVSFRRSDLKEVTRFKYAQSDEAQGQVVKTGLIEIKNFERKTDLLIWNGPLYGVFTIWLASCKKVTGGCSIDVGMADYEVFSYMDLDFHFTRTRYAVADVFWKYRTVNLMDYGIGGFNLGNFDARGGDWPRFEDLYHDGDIEFDF